MKDKLSKNSRYSLCRQAAVILKAGLPIIAASLLYILFSLEYKSGADLCRFVLALPSMLEYVFLSATILTAGALLFDYVVKRDSGQ